MAVNCCVRPTAMEAVTGDTLMLKSVSACDRLKLSAPQLC